MQESSRDGSDELAPVVRPPLAGMRQNSLRLTDWTKGLTMPDKKRAAENKKLQQKLVDVVAPAEPPAGGVVVECDCMRLSIASACVR
jgi:hypothetical protein